MSTTEERLEQAKILLESGKGEEARLMLLELLKSDTNNIAALLMLGGNYFSGEMYAEAELVYERLVKMEPGSGMMSIALFNVLMKQGRHEEAANEIRRFIAIADKVQERETFEQYAEISRAIAEGSIVPESTE